MYPNFAQKYSEIFNKYIMIGIFRTNINTRDDRNRVIAAITARFSVTDCSVDIEDCDKVLRVVCQEPSIEENTLLEFVQHMGYQCAVLE